MMMIFVMMMMTIIKWWKRRVTLIVISAQFLREITELSLHQQILMWLGGMQSMLEMIWNYLIFFLRKIMQSDQSY